MSVDLERIAEQVQDGSGPLDPEHAQTLARYMSALSLRVQRTKKKDDGGESMEELLEAVTQIPEVREAFAAMQRRQ